MHVNVVKSLDVRLGVRNLNEASDLDDPACKSRRAGVGKG